MKIAYIVLAHKYPDQFIRLVNRLNTSAAFFIVHVDKKTASADYHRMVEGLSGLSNVVFLERHKHYWGNFSHTLVTINGIKEIFNRNIQCDYILPLTGQDYPIKSNKYIEKFLSNNKGNEFIHYFPIPRDPQLQQDERWNWEDENGGLNRMEHYHIRIFDKIYRVPGDIKEVSGVKSFVRRLIARIIPKRKIGFKPYGGSSYWCITRECAEYINTFIDENPGFVKFFKSVGIPDELFFQTIIMNSRFRDRVVNDDLRCIDWSAAGNHPKIWRKEDIETLRKSKDLIARKFDSTIDSGVLDSIDSALLTA